MDIVPVGTANGSSSTYYCDKHYVSTATSRVVYRVYNYANADGGVSVSYTHLDVYKRQAEQFTAWDFTYAAYDQKSNTATVRIESGKTLVKEDRLLSLIHILCKALLCMCLMLAI